MLHCLVNLFILKAIQINLGNFFRTVSQRTADNRGCNPSSSEDCRVTVPCYISGQFIWDFQFLADLFQSLVGFSKGFVNPVEFLQLCFVTAVKDWK